MAIGQEPKSSRIRTCDYTTCWNCGGKVDEKCSSKKAGGNASYNQGKSLEVVCSQEWRD